MAARPDAVLIAGPTASGKSALAVATARRLDGVVINADSMQVHEALAILTARPGRDEQGGVEHVLYGHVRAGSAYSVAQWLGQAERALARARQSGKVAVFVGGTGLYFRALEKGLSAVPAIDPDIRRVWRGRARGAPQTLHAELAARDPAAAAALEPTDTQRLARALEVIEATGRSILDWQRECPAAAPLAGLRVEKWLIEVDRQELRARIDRRFEAMMEKGALDEVRALLALGLAPELPVMRAIGVPQLAGHLAGRYDLDEAVRRAKAATRQYAKRQDTWFRHQTGPGWRAIAGDRGD